MMVTFSFFPFILVLFPTFAMESKQLFTRDKNFRSIIKYPAFIDKTLLIKHVLQGPKIKLITAPREFGKTTNMNMLRTFLTMPVDNLGRRDNEAVEKTRKLFKNFEIYKKEKSLFNEHVCSHPVLYVSFKNREMVEDDADAVKAVKKIIHETFKLHTYLLKSRRLMADEKEISKLWFDNERYEMLMGSDVGEGLNKLCEYLYWHYNKTVLVLVDDYDDFIIRNVFHRHVYTLQYAFNLVVDFLKGLVKNPNVGRAVLMGISNAGGLILQPENIYEFLHNHRFTGFFGFQKSEVNHLFKKLKVNSKNAADGRSYYEGYTSSNGIVLYTPYSILNFIQFKKPISYWRVCGLMEYIHGMLVYSSFEENVIKMLGGECVKNGIDLKSFSYNDIAILRNYILNKKKPENISLQKLIEVYYKYMFEQGYLSFGDKKSKPCLRIPNKEIEEDFSIELREYYISKYNLKDEQLQKCAYFFYYIVPRGKRKTLFFTRLTHFHQQLQNLFRQYKRSNRRYVPNDAELRKVMFTLSTYATDYYRRSQMYVELKGKNITTKTGRLDLFMRKGRFVVLMQVKHTGYKAPDSIGALKTMLENQYDEVLTYKKLTRGKVAKYVLIGFSSNNKGDISISCLRNTKDIDQAITEK